MAQPNTLLRLGARHEHLIDWLLTNGGFKQLGACAQHFGISQPWLSSIMRSNVFQEEYRRRREVLNNLLATDVAAEETFVIKKALGRLSEAMDDPDTSPSFILQAYDKIAARRNPSPAPAVQINQLFNAPEGVVAAARARMQAKAIEE